MMETTPSDPVDASDLDSRWQLREKAWRHKLGRLRLGVEPIEQQLARYRRVTWALSVVPSVLAVMFLTLFTVFGRPDIGLLLIAILLLPIVLVAWFDYARLARRAGRYLVELSTYHHQSALRSAANPQEKATSEPE
jgi:hypothetical protein